MKAWIQVAALAISCAAPDAQAAVKAFVSQDNGGFQNVVGAPGVDYVLASLPATPNGTSGPVSASANSTTGRLRAWAGSTLGVAGGVEASAQFSDIISFDVAGSEPATVVFGGFLEATGVGLGPFGGSYIDLSLRAELLGTTLQSTGVFYARSADPSVCEPPLPSIVYFCNIGTSVAQAMYLPVELPAGNTSLRFGATLFGDAAEGASFDIWNTASIWFVVPNGVTVTPSTVGFLSAATPIPEPSSNALLLIGLLLLARLSRVRASSLAG